MTVSSGNLVFLVHHYSLCRKCYDGGQPLRPHQRPRTGDTISSQQQTFAGNFSSANFDQEDEDKLDVVRNRSTHFFLQNFGIFKAILHLTWFLTISWLVFYSLGSTSDSCTNTEDNNNQTRTAFNFANDATDDNIDGEDDNDGLKTFQKLFKNNNFHQLLGKWKFC